MHCSTGGLTWRGGGNLPRRGRVRRGAANCRQQSERRRRGWHLGGSPRGNTRLDSGRELQPNSRDSGNKVSVQALVLQRSHC